MMLQPGQDLDRYEVDALLGRGGMAVVYRVRHKQLGSFHAVKVLTLTNPQITERLLQEGRVQASMRHPNVVAVTDVIEVGGNPGLVMEYVEGPSLEEWLRDHRPSLEEAERLFRGIVSGVAAAHDKGLVHRDLKPANVMLAPSSGGAIPKVTDFGLAKALAADESLQKTRSGVTMGTPAYMAPEQIRDAKNVDHRADVFSLGCILYELACGRSPFAGPDILSIFNAVASGSYPPPVSLAPDLPARMQQAIQGCLTVDRDQRIADCHALLEVLGDGEAPAPTVRPTLLPPPDDGSIAPDSLPPRRRWWPVALAVVPIAALVLGVVAVGGGVLLVQSRWTRQLEAVDGLAWESARIRPRGALLHGVTLAGPDGVPILRAATVRLRGRWGLRGLRIRAARIEAPDLVLRRDGDGWVLPEAALDLGRVELGQGSASIEGRDGELEATWDSAVLTDSVEVRGLRLSGEEGLLRAASVEMDDALLTLADVEARLRFGPDGLDLPPVLAEAAPAWAGGEGMALPFALPPRVEVTSGTLHLLDEAHADGAVRGDWTLLRATLGPGEDGQHAEVLATLGPARAVVTADLDGDDGRGTVAVSDLALAQLAPYLEDSLARRGVEPGTGTVSLAVEWSLLSGLLTARMAMDAEDVSFTGGSARLARPREEVRTTHVSSGRLDDPDHRPVDGMLSAVTDALMAPAGGATRPPVVVERPEPAPRPPMGRPKPQSPDKPGDRFGREVREALEEIGAKPGR